MKKMDELKLNMEDVAITFSADGTVNLYLPSYDDDVEMNPNDHPHVFTGIGIMMAMQDERFGAIVDEKVLAVMASAGMVEGGCGGGCGGCGGGCEVPTEENTDEG